MSKVKIEGNASGTGTLTISAPNTNTDRTINLPDDDITISAFPDAIDVNASAPADSLAIDSSGNVGVGTTSPSNQLHIKDGTPTLRISDTDANTGADDEQAVIHLAGRWWSDASNANPDADEYSNARIVLVHAQADGNGGSELAFENSGNSATGLVENMRIDLNGNLKFNSGYGSATTAYGCRAWIKMNGTGTASITESGNISSITDVSTGRYVITFSNAMVDSNYNAVYGAKDTNTGAEFVSGRESGTYSSSAHEIQCWTYAGSGSDLQVISVSFFR